MGTKWKKTTLAQILLNEEEARKNHKPLPLKSARAGRKLGLIDASKWRPARYTAADLGTMAKIPDEFIRGYMASYDRSVRGKPEPVGLL